MDILELQNKLNELNLNPEAYSILGGLRDECYILLKNNNRRWEVFYSERGLKSSLKVFESESEACEELFRRLKKDATVYQSFK